MPPQETPTPTTTPPAVVPTPEQPTTPPEQTPPQPAQPQAVMPLTETPQKGGFPKWLKIALIAGVTVLVLIGILMFVASKVVNNSTTDAVKVSDQLVSDVQSNKPNDLYALGTDGFKSITTENDIATLLKQVSPVLQGEKTTTGKIVTTTNGKTTAIVVYSIKTANGTKYIRVNLEKGTDGWKVLNFRSSDTPLAPVSE